MERRNPFTGETETERELRELTFKIGCWIVAIFVTLLLVAYMVLSFLGSLSIYTFGGVIVALVLVGAVVYIARNPERPAPPPMGHVVKTVVVGDLATCTGLVETCGRLGGGALATPLAKLPAVWVHVVVDDPSSSDPPILDFVLGEQVTIHDDTGEVSIAMKGARVLVRRTVVKTSEDDPQAIAELCQSCGIDPGSRSLRVRERWLAPNERAWVRAHVDARMGDGYRSTTMVSLVGTDAEPVTIALEPLLSHAEA